MVHEFKLDTHHPCFFVFIYKIVKVDRDTNYFTYLYLFNYAFFFPESI